MAARKSLSELIIELVLPCAVLTSSYVFDLTRFQLPLDKFQYNHAISHEASVLMKLKNRL